ncbi:lipase 1-like [Cotesia glomerata]|uniref:lipase 1-like n=1 Tax=Cotesia glomerata TaxID=32391 RepID=UPI001D034831|nr:lipase 1-like [Cotesia glomerata]
MLCDNTLTYFGTVAQYCQVIRKMIILLHFTIFSTLLAFSKSDIFKSWTVYQLLERDGYQAETHTVITEDGYILSVHRIPGRENSTPVLLSHGLLMNSAIWLIPGKGKSLAYLLADRGYDVWMSNVRGNDYTSHVNLTSDTYEFWDFSFHEMGIYDFPATINYISNITNDKVIMVGHSLGTTISFVMESERPEMADKVKLIISLGPGILFENQNYNSRIFFMFVEFFGKILRKSNIFTSTRSLQSPLLKIIHTLLCELSEEESLFCQKIYFSVLGPELNQFNNTLLAPILENVPSFSSSKILLHLLQGLYWKRLAQYDYGEKKNLEIYNSTESPAYNLTRVTSPIALIVSDDDLYAISEDVRALSELLPNVVDKYKVNYKGFTHMDFIWGIDANSLVYDHVIDLIRKFT